MGYYEHSLIPFIWLFLINVACFNTFLNFYSKSPYNRKSYKLRCRIWYAIVFVQSLIMIQYVTVSQGMFTKALISTIILAFLVLCAALSPASCSSHLQSEKEAKFFLVFLPIAIGLNILALVSLLIGKQTDMLQKYFWFFSIYI